MLRAVANPAAGGQPGTFTSLTVSGLTAGRMVYTGTGGLLSASANLTYAGTDLQLVGGAMLSYNGGFVAGNNTGLTWNGNGGVGVTFSAAGAIRLTPETGLSVIANIPTSSAGLAAGSLWNDAGTVKIV